MAGAAGMGGGSGDAAATIVAMDVLYRLGLSPAERLAFGLEMGSVWRRLEAPTSISP